MTKILDRDTLAVHVEKIVAAVVNWKKETRNPFRVKVRRLLERLIKKFGFEIVVKFVPEGSPLGRILCCLLKLINSSENVGECKEDQSAKRAKTSRARRSGRVGRRRVSRRRPKLGRFDKRNRLGRRRRRAKSKEEQVEEVHGPADGN